MGCGLSKGIADSDREAALSSSKFPPILRRRFEEIKRRIKTKDGSTLSKQMLLKQSDHHDISASRSGHGDDNGRKSLFSAEESFRAAKVIPEPELFDDRRDDNKVEKAEDKPAMEERTEEQYKGQIEEESEEEYRHSNVGCNEYLCRDSPSFKVYIEQLKDNKDDESKDEETSQNSQDDGSV